MLLNANILYEMHHTIVKTEQYRVRLLRSEFVHSLIWEEAFLLMTMDDNQVILEKFWLSIYSERYS